VALALFAGVVFINPLPAKAHGQPINVEGLACPGGYITSSFIFVTNNESGYGGYAGQEWNIHLEHYDGNEVIHFAVKCNNGVWYYPTYHLTVPQWIGYRFIGWI